MPRSWPLATAREWSFCLDVDGLWGYMQVDGAGSHGVGNRSEEIILLAKEGEKIHFDVAHLRLLTYQSAIDLEEKLPPRLDRMIAGRI